jgi:DNA-binding Lrp family transcriptional regulator
MVNGAALQAAQGCVDLDDADRRLLGALADGLPLIERPYAALGDRAGLSEAEVCRRLARLREQDLIARLGVVVRHRELGYGANAMVVWDVPDEQARAFGRRLAGFPFVSLCYRRARSLPEWPYNLYCMIHARSREAALAQVGEVVEACLWHEVPREVLFSTRRFKQCGARYAGAGAR